MLTTVLIIALIFFFVLSIIFIILFFMKTNCPSSSDSGSGSGCPPIPNYPSVVCQPEETPISTTAYTQFNYFGYYGYRPSSGVCTPLSSTFDGFVYTGTQLWTCAITNNTQYYIKIYFMGLFTSNNCAIGGGDIWNNGIIPIPPSDGVTYLQPIANDVLFEITWAPAGGQLSSMDIYLNGNLLTPQPNVKNASVNYTSPQSFDVTIDIGSNGLPVANMSTNY